MVFLLCLCNQHCEPSVLPAFEAVFRVLISRLGLEAAVGNAWLYLDVPRVNALTRHKSYFDTKFCTAPRWISSNLPS